VTSVTGSKVLRILKGHGLGPEIPEDLYFLIKKAVSMRKHLERNRKDKDGKFRLILIESRIHRLARYYKVRMATAAAAAGVGSSRIRGKYAPSSSS
jgi:small subunit ribosomal protein S13e